MPEPDANATPLAAASPVGAERPLTPQNDPFSQRLEALAAQARQAAARAQAKPETPVDDFTSRVQAELARLRRPAGLAAGLTTDADAPAQSPEEVPPPEPEEDAAAEPVGAGEYVVSEGECISSIAKETGHFWKTLWSEPRNAELREARQDPNVLLPGDRVTIPEVRPKEEPGETEARHRFVRRGEPAGLRMRIRGERGPRANQPFSLEVDGEPYAEGVTDANGVVATPLPPGARRGRLTVGEPPDRIRMRLHFGHLSPLNAPTGVAERLRNLGFLCGRPAEATPEQVRAALQTFQSRHGLPPSGELDAATRRELRREHGN